MDDVFCPELVQMMIRSCSFIPNLQCLRAFFRAGAAVPVRVSGLAHVIFLSSRALPLPVVGAAVPASLSGAGDGWDRI